MTAKMAQVGLIGFVLLLSALPAKAASPTEAPPRDYLAGVYQLAHLPARFFLLYDACVLQGFIDDSGGSVVVKLQDSIDRYKMNYDKYRPSNISLEEVAAAQRRALDDEKEKIKLHPLKLDQPHCDMIKNAWPTFSKRYDIH